MKLKSIVVTMVLIAPLFVITPTVSAESEDPPIIGFDFDNGMSIVTNDTGLWPDDGWISLTGTIEFNTLPDYVGWNLHSDSQAAVQSYGNSITESLQELQADNGRTTWSWEADIQLLWGHCTCYFDLVVTHDGMSWKKVRVIFMGETMRSGLLIHSPDPISRWTDHTLDVSNVADYEWVHDSLTVTGWTSHPTVWASPETRFFTTPAYNAADTCIEAGDSDTTQLLSVISIDGEYSVILNVSSLDDGWYNLYVENYDPSGVSDRQTCVGIRINNAPPEIVISGDSYYIEGLGEITFDTSESDDPFWGREGLEYMWVLRKPSHSGQTPIDIQIGGSTYSMPADSGGDYSLTLRLTDSGGVSSTSVFEFVIENQKPNAAGSISGIPIIDGDTIRLSGSDGWELDAIGSSDTENDVSSLRCIWKIDYEPIYEGCQRTLTWSKTESDSCILTLEVIDNDETFSSISVILIHPDSTEPLPYSLIVLLVSALFLISAIFLRYRSSDDSTGIPSWDSDSDK